MDFKLRIPETNTKYYYLKSVHSTMYTEQQTDVQYKKDRMHGTFQFISCTRPSQVLYKWRLYEAKWDCTPNEWSPNKCDSTIVLNLRKKVPGKKVSGKKLGNKNFRKKFEFYQVLGKNVTGNKVLCFGFLGRFFPKIVWGLPLKSQEIRSREKKSWRK